MLMILFVLIATLICLIATLLSLVIIIQYYYFKQDTCRHTSFNEAIVVSGCDSGIGLELVKYLHETCKFKIICGFLGPHKSIGYKQLSELSERSKDGRLILKKLDVTSEEDVEQFVRGIDQLKTNGTFSRLTTLINNAGVLTYGEFDWLTWKQIQAQIDVNLIGTLRLTRAIVPHIIESKGRIINVSSVNDATVFPGLSVYSATKGAISTFSRGLGYELKKFGVKVVTMRLGDFARLTNIMSGHTSNRDDMWKEMNSKKRAMYDGFFHQFNDHLLKNYGMTSPKDFDDSSLFDDFKVAVLSKNPPTTITCAPLSFKVFYFVIEMTPVWLQYHILDLLIRVGFQWKAPDLVNRATRETLDDFEHLE